MPKNPEFINKPYVREEKAGKKAYCVCGLTDNPPYCDGSHKATDCKPIICEIEKDRRVAWCGCRQSRELPFCDGSHTCL